MILAAYESVYTDSGTACGSFLILLIQIKKHCNSPYTYTLCEFILEIDFDKLFRYEKHAADSIIPRLLFALSRLEMMVTKHEENKSTIKALHIEQEDLKREKQKKEEQKHLLEMQVAQSENSNKLSERQMQVCKWFF